MEEDLRKLGFGEYEIKIYLALLSFGPLKSKQLSKRSTVPQSKIYETVYRLAEKHFISVLETKPKVFKAVDPEIAIKGFLNEKRDEIKRLENILPKKLKLLSKHSIKEQLTDQLITIYRGKKSSHPMIIHKYQTAKKYIKNMFTFEYLPYSVINEIEKCAKRKVKIYMLVTKKSDEMKKLVTEMKRMGIEVRYYPVTELRIAIKDGIESYQQIVDSKDLLNRITLVIESLELTKALEHYFDFLWKKAEKL